MSSDTISNPVELPKIMSTLDLISSGVDPVVAFQGSHVSVWHNGLVVIVRGFSPTRDGSITFLAFRWNGTSWDNLDFPVAIGDSAPGIDPDTGDPVPGLTEPYVYDKFMRLVSDGTTMWFAFCIDETKKDAPSGPSNPDAWWRNMTTYVWTFDESSGWSPIMSSRGFGRHNIDDVVNGHGYYDHQLGTHEGAGYAWLVQNEAGIMGLDWHELTPIGGGGLFPYIYQWHAYAFMDVLVSGTRLTPTGNDATAVMGGLEDPAWYVEQVAQRDLVHPWILDGPGAPIAPAFTGSAAEMAWAKIFAVITDAGFPLIITNVLSGHPADHQLLDWTTIEIGTTELHQAPLSAINLEIGEQLQATNDVMATGTERTVYDAWVADGTVYLNTAWDSDPAIAGTPGLATAQDLFYPEEVDIEGTDFFEINTIPFFFGVTGDDRSRVRLFKIPIDASTRFEPVTNQSGEDVSLAKNPLESFGPKDWARVVTHFGAITTDNNVWLITHAFDQKGDGLIYPFHLGTCPLTPPEHGRYAWDWARDSDGSLIHIEPFFSDGGIFFVGSDWFNGPTDSMFNTVYNPDEKRIYVIAWAKADDGNTYLRAWYFQLCIGCDKCIQGMHLWQIL